MTEECFVPPDKIKNYLLNFESESGGPKAKFFTQAGFSLVNIPVFIEALKEHYLNRTHCSEYDSKHGQNVKLKVRFKLLMAAGK